MNNIVLEAENLTKLFQTEAEQVQALNGVSLTARSGEFIALMGPSGSGKSTLLQMLGGLDERRPERERVQALLTELGLGDRAGHKPSQLSGGQQQCVAVARALITDPAIILANEPTGNLDSAMADEIIRLLRRCVDQYGRTVIMVTHDPKAAAYADRVISLRDGRVVDETKVGGGAFARSSLAGLAESY